jgi:hypothetical protein
MTTSSSTNAKGGRDGAGGPITGHVAVCSGFPPNTAGSGWLRAHCAAATGRSGKDRRAFNPVGE